MLEMTLLDKEQMVSHKRSTTLSKVAKTSLRNPRLRISLHSCEPYKSAGFVLRHHDTALSLPNAVYLSFSSILFVSNLCPVRAVHCTVFTGWLLLACRAQIPMPRFLAMIALDTQFSWAESQMMRLRGFLVWCQHPEPGAAAINPPGLFQLADLRRHGAALHTQIVR